MIAVRIERYTATDTKNKICSNNCNEKKDKKNHPEHPEAKH